MKYLFVSTVLASVWLQGAWSEGLIGIWGLIASLGILSAWALMIGKEGRKNARTRIYTKRKA